MKRFWALAIALAALVVWTVPALAEVKFGGEYRLRAETRDMVDFDDADGDSFDNKYSWYGQRVRLTGVATPTDDVTVKITLQDTRNWGECGEGDAGGPWLSSTIPSSCYWWSGPSIHESFLQINKFFGTPISLKVGRQELVYGDQRLVGNFGWSNYGRSFDALKLMYSNDTVNVDAWTSKLFDDNIGDFGDAGVAVAGATSDDDTDFHGIYATIKAIPNNTLDVYLLWTRDGSPAVATTESEITADIKTYGVRLAGAIAGIDYTAEVPFQTGEVDCGAATLCDVDASALAVKLGYAIPGGPMGLKVGAEYDLASGDKDGAADGDIETFYNLFPTNHDKYGTMDLQGWRNMKAWNVNVSVKPTAKLTARLDYWDFSLDEEDDAWYGAGNWNNTPGAFRAPSAAACGAACTEDELGQEIDITLNYKYNDAVGIMAGVSQFFIGDAVEERVAGTDEEDQTWGFVQLTATF